MKYEDKYKQNLYPDLSTRDPKKKDMPYCIKKAESIYSAYLKGRSGIAYDATSVFETLREFGDGRQSENRYRDFYLKDESPQVTSAQASDVDGVWTEKKDTKKKAYVNLLWDIVSPASKVMNILLGIFDKGEYDIVAVPVDSNSRSLIEDEKLKLWITKENLQFMKAYYAQADVDFNEPEFLPESQDELELYEAQGGFKPAFSRIMEGLVRHTMDLSVWPELKRALYKDLINIGIIAIKDYYDPEDDKVKSRYVDPKNFVIQYSQYPDFRDSEYAGEFIDVSVSELLARGFTREQLREVAKYYSGYNGNPMSTSWKQYDKLVEGEIYGYDFYKICVLDAEWKEVDTKKEIVKKNRMGKEIIIETGLDDPTPVADNVSDRDPNKYARFVDKRMRYGCKWIVGTQYAYEWGPCYDITRPSKKDVSLSYHCYRLQTKSITEQLFPVYDQFMILWLKLQNALAMAVNSGYAINYDAISNMKINSKNPESEIIKRWMQSGVLIFKETNKAGVKNTNFRPVEQLPGGMGSMFNELMLGFQFNAKMVEDISGLNPLALGGTPDPNAPVGTSEIAMNSTANTLKPISSAYLRVKQMFAENIVRWIQILMKYNKDAQVSYAKVFGQFDVEVLKTAEGDGVEYGINLVAKPTELQRKEIYEAAKVSMTNGRDGKPGITEADFMTIVNILDGGGSLKLAEMIMNDRIRKAVKEGQQRAMQNVQAQGQVIKEQDQNKMMLELEVYREKKKIDLEYEKQLAKIKMGENVMAEVVDFKKQQGLQQTSSVETQAPAIAPPITPQPVM